MTRPIPDRLDRILADVEELKRRQQFERIQQMNAEKAGSGTECKMLVGGKDEAALLAILRESILQHEIDRQLCAEMASEIERIKREDWKEPEDLIEFAKTGEVKEIRKG